MKDTKPLKEPLIIGIIILIVFLFLYLVLKPILSTDRAKNIRVSKVSSNHPILKDFPENYSEIEITEEIKIEESVIEEPAGLENPAPIKIPEKIIKCENVIVKPVKKKPPEIEIAKAKGIVSNIGFPGFKPRKPPEKKDPTHSITASLQRPASKYLIQAGSIISAITITGINSDLPGHVVAQVDRNTYDSISGLHLLIPHGCKLIGSYNSKIKLNQKRIQISWQEIKLQDGSTINLGKGMPGTGKQGHAGVTGSINNHLMSNMVSIFSVALMTSSAKQVKNSSTGSLGDELTGDAANDIADIGSDIFEKQIKMSPTIQIKIGTPIQILVTNDLAFEEPYND